ncbi:ABC transporter permease [Halanaerobium sp. ST460_2HS_T2]|uniref:ABC transporter permease n=1 Tax=Halanaerobium sp. ST460_2HS_T2 TaxID=2183914 RepID=UPI000DF357E3|nr:ABC transporter permease [Halanaerobium sp. ST460_2HS_T2]RCW55382.1 peptide/nickel transport system permease protein [Halanaerobium sp. ST460_2HS_T2]
MLAYTFRRLLTIIPTLLIASILIFSFMHLMPGDPAAVMLGTNATPEQVEKLRVQLGLDRPIYIQFATWFKDAFRGDLGDSIFFQSPVLSVIQNRAETSIFVATFSMLIILILGIPIGVISAVKYNTVLDQLTMGFAMLAASIPTFWLGLNLMILFSVNLNWLPSSGFPSVVESGNLNNLKYLILPCVTLAAPNSALIIRLTRSSMLDVMKEEYVKTARAKGLKESIVILKHIFRNAIISIVSALGFTFIALLSGTVVTETVFSLPGVGRLVVQSVLRRDYPVIQGIIFVVVILYVFINLLTDLSYAFLDPRISYE